jgi:glycosyltransferase involved in cell wall biosynthesis
MKLVVDLRLINASGIGSYLKNVFPHIIEEFDEVVVLGNKDEILKFDWSNKIEIIEFNCKIYLFTEQIKYLQKIPRCDIYWCPHFNAPLLPIKAKKMIVTIYDVNHLANPIYFSFLKRIWAKILYINAAKKSNIILTISEFSKSEIIKYLKVEEQKIEIVSCGVNPNFSLITASKETLSSLPNKYFLFVGNVKPHKNLITLLKAYNKLNARVKQEYKLVILGKMEGFVTNDNQIFKYIENNNLSSFVHFTGYISDSEVPSIYKNATIFVFPSLYEGFGLPILEAMVCEVPVISSNKASLPEVGGNAVLYFEPLNENSLAELIIQLTGNKEMQLDLIEKGKKRVKHFTWESVISRHSKIMKKLF